MGGRGSIARSAAPDFFKRYTPSPKEWWPRPLSSRIPSAGRTGLHAAWLGHSTVLLKIDGFTILTDPVLGARCGVRMGPVTVGSAAGGPRGEPRAFTAHRFDSAFARAFRSFRSGHAAQSGARGTAVVTAKYTSDLLRVHRYQSVQEVGWDERVRVGPLSILGIRVKHWGARMRSDVHRGYNGYLIETARHRVVFGGDTAWTDSFKAAQGRKPVDLAILPIGAYDPWIHVHCNPEEAWRMGADCGAEHLAAGASSDLPVEPRTLSGAGGALSCSRRQPSRSCSDNARGARMVAGLAAVFAPGR